MTDAKPARPAVYLIAPDALTRKPAWPKIRAAIRQRTKGAKLYTFADVFPDNALYEKTWQERLAEFSGAVVVPSRRGGPQLDWPRGTAGSGPPGRSRSPGAVVHAHGITDVAASGPRGTRCPSVRFTPAGSRVGGADLVTADNDWFRSFMLAAAMLDQLDPPREEPADEPEPEPIEIPPSAAEQLRLTHPDLFRGEIR